MDMTHEQRRDTIVTHAWEKWTRNGIYLDDEARRATEKSVRDATNNSYVDDITDTEWLEATLSLLDYRNATD
jgi:hypothetical protein